MTDDSILALVRSQAQAIALCSDGVPNLLPIPTLRDVETAERVFDVCFSPLLRLIDVEVATGGYELGPGYGLLGLPGGYDNDGDWNVVKTSLEMSREYDGWKGSRDICDWNAA